MLSNPSSALMLNALLYFITPKAAFFLQVPNFTESEIAHRPWSDSLLHFDSQNIYQIRKEKSNSSAWRLLLEDMHERWPHFCRVKITFTLLPTNSFVSTTTNSMKCLVNWIPERIRVRSRNARTHIKAGFGFVRTNVRFLWNPSYKAFHPLCFCGNKRLCPQ